MENENRLKHDTNEPTHDKTNNMTVRPAKTQISLSIRPVWSESSLSALRNLGSLAMHWSQSKDSGQTGRFDIWVFAGRTGHFPGFVVLRLKSTEWSVYPERNKSSLSIRPVWSVLSLCALWVTKDGWTRLRGCNRFGILDGWMDGLRFLRPFQKYFGHFRTMEGWTWKALRNEAPFPNPRPREVGSANRSATRSLGLLKALRVKIYAISFSARSTMYWTCSFVRTKWQLQLPPYKGANHFKGIHKAISPAGLSIPLIPWNRLSHRTAKTTKWPLRQVTPQINPGIHPVWS